MNPDDAALSGRRRGCNCKKSGCLKLYCECFAAGGRCSERCQCVSCKNQEHNQEEIAQAIQAIEKRTQKSFRPTSKASDLETMAEPANQPPRSSMTNRETPATFPTERKAAMAMAGTLPRACRNTETFVSAKKMLVFAGVSADDSDLRVTIRPSQRKLVKRPSRGSKSSEPQNGMRTPTNASTQRPSALELLSRSAPAASSKLHQRNDSAMDGIPPTTPTKRPSSHMDLVHTSDRGVVTPTFAKRKYTRRSFSQLPFMERIREAAVPAVELPNVEDTVTNAYDARNTEGVGDPELTILSRSLLHTAMAVEFAEEEKEAADIPSTGQASLDQQTGVSKPLRTPDPSDGREALSPTAAGLFCEEEYSEAAADDHALATNGNRTTSHSNTTDHEGNHKEKNLSVMQERAVLQEFSVWLRNLATGLSQ
ncbi:hypothetical protein PC116_g6915 [Phytophthora cactorum]|nr:hypothetical protein PC114_g4540 [Phytophthora cactorum]KAG4245258.1 hypothetical protein PC116_g6915 [Phytophthora cactorum]